MKIYRGNLASKLIYWHKDLEKNLSNFFFPSIILLNVCLFAFKTKFDLTSVCKQLNNLKFLKSKFEIIFFINFQTFESTRKFKFWVHSIVFECYMISYKETYLIEKSNFKIFFHFNVFLWTSSLGISWHSLYW
jgi:hypothetical protein